MNSLPKSLLATSAIAVTLSMGKMSQAITLIKSQDFAGDGPDVSSLFYNLGNGLELTVTAGVHSGGANANAPLNITGSANITQKGGSRAGIGARSSEVFFNDSSQLDAFGLNEFLRFTFNQEVTLLSTIFEDVSSSTTSFLGRDEFDLGIDGIDVGINRTFGDDVLRSFPDARFSGGSDRLVDFSSGVNFDGNGTNVLLPAKGSVFDFYTDDDNDSYRIREIRVALDVPDDVPDTVDESENSDVLDTEDVPENISTFSLLAFATLGAVSTLKRKLKRSKFIKKELEKIS